MSLFEPGGRWDSSWKLCCKALLHGETTINVAHTQASVKLHGHEFCEFEGFVRRSVPQLATESIHSRNDVSVLVFALTSLYFFLAEGTGDGWHLITCTLVRQSYGRKRW